jgi:hypothetical protein
MTKQLEFLTADPCESSSHPVYIVAVGWLYVVIMMTATGTSFVSGAEPRQATSLTKNRTSAIEPMPSEINTTCSRVARNSGRRCSPGIRSATET